jgi:hypothetical protein
MCVVGFGTPFKVSDISYLEGCELSLDESQNALSAEKQMLYVCMGAYPKVSGLSR